MNLFEVYKLWDIEPVRGLDTKLWDKDGIEYTDMYGGHAVISVGHCHPHYVSMLTNQLGKLGFYSNAVQNSLQKELAEKLGKVCGYEDYSLFLCNSGAEANENALKTASFHTGKSKVLAFRKAFHGRTSGAVAATDNPKIQSPFNRTGNVVFSELNDLEAAGKELSKGDFAAVIIEGIQGVAGIYEPSADFLHGLRSLCDKYGCLLVLDEIQSGYGRTGKFFAHQHHGVRADIITTAKGMANGFPIGGVLLSPSVKAEYGMLGTTFGGNHLACTAALAVLDIIENEHLVENAARTGEYFRKAFEGDRAIKEYRGKGLMIGLELNEGFAGLRDRLLFERHFFTGAAGASVIRLLPSLTISQDTAEAFVKAWKELTGQA
ncbi:MAG: aminotransferase class III-fold pyridoxal phosphate-dependent enzyme [Bacteroidales bacterium]|nr:aminotransferase class III-fold pyridoxal phosphate-dependent enzyme [Bacteroidales bacterium]